MDNKTSIKQIRRLHSTGNDTVYEQQVVTFSLIENYFIIWIFRMFPTSIINGNMSYEVI